MSEADTRAGESTLTLLRRATSGDDAALDDLYQRYLAPLQRWARGRLPGYARDLMETDDLVQETLMRSLHHVDRFEPRHRGSFQAYLRRGVLNRIRDEIRRAQRGPDAVGTAGRVEDPGPDPVEHAIGSQMLERYEKALDGLTAGDQEAVLARVELGFTYREIAAILDKPSPDAARMAVSRALVRLAEGMSR